MKTNPPPMDARTWLATFMNTVKLTYIIDENYPTAYGYRVIMSLPAPNPYNLHRLTAKCHLLTFSVHTASIEDLKQPPFQTTIDTAPQLAGQQFRTTYIPQWQQFIATATTKLQNRPHLIPKILCTGWYHPHVCASCHRTLSTTAGRITLLDHTNLCPTCCELEKTAAEHETQHREHLAIRHFWHTGRRQAPPRYIKVHFYDHQHTTHPAVPAMLSGISYTTTSHRARTNVKIALGQKFPVLPQHLKWIADSPATAADCSPLTPASELGLSLKDPTYV